MKYRVFFFIFIILLVALYSFQVTGRDLGERIDFGRMVIFYENGVTRAEAFSVVEYLDKRIPGNKSP